MLTFLGKTYPHPQPRVGSGRRDRGAIEELGAFDERVGTAEDAIGGPVESEEHRRPRAAYDVAMSAAAVPEYRIVAGAVRAELARRRIPRSAAVAALQSAGIALGRTAAYERIAGLVPFTWPQLEALSSSLGIPIDILAGTRTPDVAAVGS